MVFLDGTVKTVHMCCGPTVHTKIFGSTGTNCMISMHLRDVVVSCSIARDRQLQRLCHQPVDWHQHPTLWRTSNLPLNFITVYTATMWFAISHWLYLLVSMSWLWPAKKCIILTPNYCETFLLCFNFVECRNFMIWMWHFPCVLLVFIRPLMGNVNFHQYLISQL